jgi:D-glycero-beta-D-manno-heptose 1-phosphate adenylyltransferase
LDKDLICYNISNKDQAVGLLTRFFRAIRRLIVARTNGIFGDGSNFDCRYIPDYEKLKLVVQGCQAVGYRVVLMQGVYDLLHEPHCMFLEAGRALGDVLIVGVDSDELARQRKGPGRPIVPEMERMRLLVHSRHVDIITLRKTSDRLEELVETVHPDILVLSESTSDIKEEHLNYLRGHCGQLVSLPPMSVQVSTTARIRQIHSGGIAEARAKFNAMFDEWERSMKGAEV